MTTSWVAGTVRAKSLARRRLGAAGARSLARSPNLDAALRVLRSTPYGHDVHQGQSLAEAEHAVGCTLLWHLRVLAGWLPGPGADSVRVLARGFEIANVDEHLAALRGGPADPPYRLGALETAWSRLSPTTSLDELREVMRSSVWGDPGEATPRAVHACMRLEWADRVMSAVPEAAGWAQAATVLFLVRQAVLEDMGPPDFLAHRASQVVGRTFVDELSGGSPDLHRLSTALPGQSRWVLDGIDAPGDLWRAETSWWHRVERDGFGLLRQAGFDRAPVVGTAAVLAADAWRVRAALETAARGGVTGTGTGGATHGPDPMEAFDGVA